MNKKSRTHTCQIIKESYCKTCGWPIIFACCNDEFSDYVLEKTSQEWRWWVYCTNKGCKNHEGEGISANYKEPGWVKEEFKTKLDHDYK